MKNIVRYFSFGDLKLFYVINDNIKCKILDFIMPYITNLGGVIFSISLPLILIGFGKDKIRLLGIEALISLSASHLLVQILKRTVTRIRPYDILDRINTFNINLNDYSFPSGHTTASFSIGLAIAFNISSLMIPAIIIASLVGISRVYLGVHYPSDVFVGALLGIVSAIVTHSMFLKYIII